MTVQIGVNSKAIRHSAWTAMVLLAAWLMGHISRAETVPQVELIAEVRTTPSSDSSSVATAKGSQYVFKQADTLTQGQEIFYTLRIRNPGKQAIQHPEVIQRVPANTRYIADTATGAGAQIQFSMDGGQQFLDAGALPTPLTSAAGHRITPYTHLRWQLKSPLPPGAVVLARFRAEFQ